MIRFKHTIGTDYLGEFKIFTGIAQTTAGQAEKTAKRIELKGLNRPTQRVSIGNVRADLK
jgi:hypothetical protein